MTSNHIRIAALALLLVSGFTTSLQAQGLLAMAAKSDPRAVAEKDVLSGKVKLNPAMGYIFISGPGRQFGQFLRVPDDAARADWEKDRLKAFEKSLKSYRSNYAQWLTNKVQLEAHKMKVPDAPIEPKLETFQFEPLELRDAISFGPQFVYAKGDTIAYLQAVKPGTYIWYGNVLGGNGLPGGGTCLCMGTVHFEVRAGVVTDTGNWFLAAPHVDEDMDFARLALKEDNEKRVAAGKEPRLPLARTDIKFGLPASLKDWPSVQAEFYANGKLNNFYGIFISRLPPVPGVLGYHRDIPVDLRAGQEIESPTLVSRAKIKR